VGAGAVGVARGMVDSLRQARGGFAGAAYDVEHTVDGSGADAGLCMQPREAIAVDDGSASGFPTAVPISEAAVAGDTFAIDTRMSGYAGITAAYLIAAPSPCLVETGTAMSAETVRAALERLGVGPRDLATIVVTHIHLDHAGGVGDLAEAFPEARIVVHEAGARHLVDPERLMASSRRVFGRALDELMGELRPTPAERVVAVADRGAIDLGGGRTLETHHAPGHAKHHIGLLDSQTGDLYVGDAAGVYVPETGDLRPATPPPDFDLDLARQTLRRFHALEPTRLVFTHYGPVSPAGETLDRSLDELEHWVELVRETRREELDLGHAVAAVVERTRDRYEAFFADQGIERKFEELSSTAANVAGINRWLDKREGPVRPPEDPATVR
jgi:glyoxylase-like metal-dependent hydrolase (beta-lactamase superfamily II)